MTLVFVAPVLLGVGLPAALSSVDPSVVRGLSGRLAGRSTRWSRWSR